MNHATTMERALPFATGRMEKEREWHDKHFAERRPAGYEISAAVIERYLRLSRPPLFYKEAMFRLAGDVCGKRVLVVGCGDDPAVSLLALAGADVWAFDISEQAIATQLFIAAANNVQGKVRFAVTPAEAMPWAGERFDVIWGTMILHHLPEEIPAVMAQVRERLVPGGVALFAEPVVLSKAMMRARRVVPLHTDISPGERQLTGSDLAAVESGFVSRRHYFRLLARLHRLTLCGPLETAPWLSRMVTLALAWADRALLAVPMFRRLAGTVVLELRAR